MGLIQTPIQDNPSSLMMSTMAEATIKATLQPNTHFTLCRSFSVMAIFIIVSILILPVAYKIGQSFLARTNHD